ncbi:unnamed protein product [Paramecium pentaurelia]|uniref:Protein kinase domain-containing protein n=1 Tax=Paramecium pentaurelia TaxID=43138 RepID=A0A8S1VI52_9CILI|nr:unnamed protein product [Paramecium pentaurelia]
MVEQILIDLDYLNRIFGVIHTDLKPQNIQQYLSDEKIKDIVENGQFIYINLTIFKQNSYLQKHGIYKDEEDDFNEEEENQMIKIQRRKCMLDSSLFFLLQLKLDNTDFLEYY